MALASLVHREWVDNLGCHPSMVEQEGPIWAQWDPVVEEGV